MFSSVQKNGPTHRTVMSAPLPMKNAGQVATKRSHLALKDPNAERTPRASEAMEKNLLSKNLQKTERLAQLIPDKNHVSSVIRGMNQLAKKISSVKHRTAQIFDRSKKAVKAWTKT